MITNKYYTIEGITIKPKTNIILKEGTLLATSPTIEGIKKMIAAYWYDKPDNINLIPISDTEWDVGKMSSGKIIDSVKVTLQKGRYRFEGR